MNFSLLQRNLSNLGIGEDIQYKIIKTFILLVILSFIKIVLTRILNTKAEHNELLYKWEKIISYTFYISALLIVGNVWFKGVQSLATFLGLLSAGLAVAFKDYLSNIAGWIYILWMEPLKIGHRVLIGNIIGDVIDIGPVHLSLLEIKNSSNSEQPTGKIIFLPNSKIFTESVANYDISFPYIWHEVHIVVTFESDWKKAKRLIHKIIDNNSLVYDEISLRKFKVQSRKFLIPKVSLNPEVFTSTVNHGVMLSARFVCEPRSRRQLENKVWEEVLGKFNEEDCIDFAYPTQRFYNNTTEGKSYTPK